MLDWAETLCEVSDILDGGQGSHHERLQTTSPSKLYAWLNQNYSKTRVKRPLAKRLKIGFKDK